MAATQAEALHRDPDWLERKTDAGWGIDRLADEADVAREDVIRQLAEHDVDASSKGVTNEELLAELKAVAAEVGGAPSTEDFRLNSDLVHYRTFTRRFGSWQEALEAAGIDGE